MKYFRCMLALAALTFPASAYAQTFTTLVQFTGTGGTASGKDPGGGLTLTGTTLYGMTELGGTKGDGNIFSVGVDGSNYQNLLSFTGTAGAAVGQYPNGSLTLGGTTLYGMTSMMVLGATSGSGSVFSIGIDGTNYRNLVAFTGSSGSAIGQNPTGSLALSGTRLYGMTVNGGANDIVSGVTYGNVFSVGTGGTGYQNLTLFTGSGGSASGWNPFGSPTLVGTSIYGMTYAGGATEVGNIFTIGVNGSNYQNLVAFTGNSGTANGFEPYGDLTLGDTTFYGMTSEGGDGTHGNIFSVGLNSTNFQNLVSFTGSGGTASGSQPNGSLLLSGTTLYGMTPHGGTGYGEIFSVGIDGSSYEDLHNFTGIDGDSPFGDLTLSGGTLFGMTHDEGANGDGTIFALALPTPEPSTPMLIGAGAFALAAYRWRRML